MPDAVEIPGRFNGPLHSGNGGYTAGLLAGLVGGGDVAEVNLRSPVPLDRALDVVREDRSLRVLDGEALVADAHPVATVDAEVPEPVSVAEARAATQRYRGLSDGQFSHCFVCGRARDDALGVFAGQVDDRELVATPWTPPVWTADDSGAVRPEFVWAVLDCPTYFALYLGRELETGFLVRMSARTEAPVVAGEEQVVIAWPIERDGRKLHAGSAVLSAAGETLAIARALMIETSA